MKKAKKGKKGKGKRLKKSSHLKSKIFLIVISILLITTLILSLFETNIFKKDKNLKIHLKDECSILFNNLIHSIKTSGNCKSICSLECERKNLEFKSINFTKKENSCNNCDCYCK